MKIWECFWIISINCRNVGKDGKLKEAINAAVNIRPEEAAGLLLDLTDSDDQDIADAAYEAISMAEALLELSDDEDDDELP